MSQLSYLYRRPGGIYAVRICVPVRFQLRLGKREIHVSTKVREVALAKGTAYPIVSYWKRLFLEWDGIVTPPGSIPPNMASVYGVQSHHLSHHPTPASTEQSVLTCSALLLLFIEAKKGDWAEDQQRKMKTMCGMFVDLMGDQLVQSVSRQMLRSYQQKLLLLPRNIYQTRRKFSVTSASELRQLTAKYKLDTMTLVTSNNYMQKLGEMFGWAVREDYLIKNPTLNLTQTRPKKRDQDARDVFDAADLNRIFSAPWFSNGGNYPAAGPNKNFRPHHYWLPLLGLYTGARLNEICQLNLEDIRDSSDGTWLIHINDSQTENIEPNISSRPRKKLKTTNANRVIGVHHHLIKLGLITYKKHLEALGYSRLFPELRFDDKKGFGKAAGKWFNDRYLGEILKMPRDGRKCFHSLRHMFISELFKSEIPEAYIAQLAGHERGETISAKRYRKDVADQQLAGYVDRLDFKLPEIQPFACDAAAGYLREALRRRIKEV
ncbi:tyrosine-type recombinase/integrase [Pseudomonas sp.]|jgi:integrase|uniref:tyrosine-type recombinase/integrase n=1 Tax=Pseudomonas sp. TaxID=306 RepID=UPI003FD7E3D5